MLRWGDFFLNIRLLFANNLILFQQCYCTFINNIITIRLVILANLAQILRAIFIIAAGHRLMLLYDNLTRVLTWIFAWAWSQSIHYLRDSTFNNFLFVRWAKSKLYAVVLCRLAFGHQVLIHTILLSYPLECLPRRVKHYFFLLAVYHLPQLVSQ